MHVRSGACPALLGRESSAKMWTRTWCRSGCTSTTKTGETWEGRRRDREQRHSCDKHLFYRHLSHACRWHARRCAKHAMSALCAEKMCVQQVSVYAKDTETMGQIHMNSDHNAMIARTELPIDHKTQQINGHRKRQHRNKEEATTTDSTGMNTRSTPTKHQTHQAPTRRPNNTGRTKRQARKIHDQQCINRRTSNSNTTQSRTTTTTNHKDDSYWNATQTTPNEDRQNKTQNKMINKKMINKNIRTIKHEERRHKIARILSNFHGLTNTTCDAKKSS